MHRIAFLFLFVLGLFFYSCSQENSTFAANGSEGEHGDSSESTMNYGDSPESTMNVVLNDENINTRTNTEVRVTQGEWNKSFNKIFRLLLPSGTQKSLNFNSPNKQFKSLISKSLTLDDDLSISGLEPKQGFRIDEIGTDGSRTYYGTSEWNMIECRSGLIEWETKVPGCLSFRCPYIEVYNPGEVFYPHSYKVNDTWYTALLKKDAEDVITLESAKLDKDSSGWNFSFMNKMSDRIKELNALKNGYQYATKREANSQNAEEIAEYCYNVAKFVADSRYEYDKNAILNTDEADSSYDFYRRFANEIAYRRTYLYYVSEKLGIDVDELINLAEKYPDADMESDREISNVSPFNVYTFRYAKNLLSSQQGTVCCVFPFTKGELAQQLRQAGVLQNIKRPYGDTSQGLDFITLSYEDILGNDSSKISEFLGIDSNDGDSEHLPLISRSCRFFETEWLLDEWKTDEEDSIYESTYDFVKLIAQWQTLLYDYLKDDPNYPSVCAKIAKGEYDSSEFENYIAEEKVRFEQFLKRDITADAHAILLAKYIESALHGLEHNSYNYRFDSLNKFDKNLYKNYLSKYENQNVDIYFYTILQGSDGNTYTDYTSFPKDDVRVEYWECFLFAMDSNTNDLVSFISCKDGFDTQMNVNALVEYQISIEDNLLPPVDFTLNY